MLLLIERSDPELKKCVDFDTLPFLLDIIQTHQLAPTGDPLVDADYAAQSYHTMKQLSGESIKNIVSDWRISIEFYKGLA